MKWSRKRVIVTVVDKLLFPNKAAIGQAKLDRLSGIFEKHGINEVPLETIDLSANPRDFQLLARDHEIVFHLSAVFGGREFVDVHHAECSKMLAIDHNVISASYEAGVDRLHYS